MVLPKKEGLPAVLLDGGILLRVPPDLEVPQEDFIIMGVLIAGIIDLEYSCPD
jgi:hypothetical protein